MEYSFTEEIKKLYDDFNDIYLNKIKPFIEENFPRNKYSKPIYYILDNFALRRFRAGLPYLMAKHLNVPIEKIIPISAVSELMFTIALVQDDFFDRCNKRGELESSHIKFGPLISMASSDYSYAFAAKMLTKIRKTGIGKKTLEDIEDSFIDIQKIVFESFLMELVNEKNFNFTMEDILTLHKSKTIHGTNAIYSAALVCDDYNKTHTAQAIKNYCLNLAIAGQIKNDIYDLTRYAKVRGFSDLINGYMTYPLAKLKEVLNSDENENLKNLFTKGSAHEIVNLMEKNGIITKCIQDNKRYIQLALSNIKGIFDGELKKIFELWAEGNKLNPNQVVLNQ